MKQRRQFKSISIKLFNEGYNDEVYLLTDVISFQYNVNIDSINVYDILSFQQKKVVYIKICGNVVKKNGKSMEIKNKLRELILNEPTISSHELVALGYNSNILSRYYMGLKKEFI